MYIHKQFQDKDAVMKENNEWNTDANLLKDSNNHSLYDWYEVSRKRKRNKKRKSTAYSTGT